MNAEHANATADLLLALLDAKEAAEADAKRLAEYSRALNARLAEAEDAVTRMAQAAAAAWHRACATRGVAEEGATCVRDA